MSTSFVEVANAVATQLTELLQTQILISDGHTVVARQRFDTDLLRGEMCSVSSQYLRFPIFVHNQDGEVLVEQLVGSEAISPRIAQAFVELVVNQITHSNRQYGLLASQHLREQALKNQVIQNLLQGNVFPESNVLQQAQQLGLDLVPPRAVILINVSPFIAHSSPARGSVEGRVQRIINSIVRFFCLPKNTICAYVGSGEFVVLKASDSKNMEPWAKPAASDLCTASWTNLEALKRAGQALVARLQDETKMPVGVGIGRYHPGLSGLSKSYQDARIALRLGQQFASDSPVQCLDELGIVAFACVADEQTKVELALHLLSPLDSECDLLKTLQVFFERDCALMATAKVLVIHRNTLTYRLEKIASLTGLDPRRFDDAVQIRLALLLRSLKPSPLPPIDAVPLLQFQPTILD
ncbi:MAG: helix-turn-helix domain-containing protein [Phormidesmis sp.]